MVIIIIIFSSLSFSVKKLFPRSKTAIHVYYILFGLVYLAFLFRGNLIFWILFTTINYILIVNLYQYKIFPLLIWTLNLTIIYCNDRYHGYNIVTFFHCEALQFLEDSTSEQLISWHSVFNMTILRMISFGMDKYWAFYNRRFI